MSLLALILTAVGAAAYLTIGYAIAVLNTMDGPPQRWKRVLWRFAFLFLWPPMIVLYLLAAAVAGLFE